ncbi:MAG: division/cell wall cluster transcriptional repressor MraZ [Dehalococcoidales bacterium]|nr:MAG: division/cell wall cluster transcriptional repressor MraZ [Dehalococcoidales bacterium]
MFLGEYEYKIDDKGRVPVPPKFRRELKDGLVLAPGPESCIVAYGLVEWKKMAETLTAGSLAPSKLRRLGRATFATAFSLNLDGQGRVALPITLRQYAQIEDELVVIGANTYFEMWNRELWMAEKADAQEQAWQIIEGLERR